MDYWRWGGTGIAILGVFVPVMGFTSHLIGGIGVTVGLLVMAYPLIRDQIKRWRGAHGHDREGVGDAVAFDVAWPRKPPAAEQRPISTPLGNNRFGAWEHVDHFKVSEAANLWAGYLPSPSYLLDKGQRPRVLGAERLIASELKGALDMSEMPGYFTGDDYSSAYVARADLLALAEKKGVRPRFLYPNG